jgi:predicted Na+-dependent transporter
MLLTARSMNLPPIDPDTFVTSAESILLVLMAVFIMLGMGASTTPRDFLSALRRPAGLLIGWVTQFGIMPLLSYVMVVLLLVYTTDLGPTEIWFMGIGALLMGSVPAGTTSNIFTYFSKGNLALSVMMTTNSTIWALLMTPLALYVYGEVLLRGQLPDPDMTLSADLTIPIVNVVVTIAIMLVPVFVAMGIRRYNANVGAILELLGGLLGILFIVYLIVTWVPRNFSILAGMPWQVYFITTGLGLFGILIAYQLARAVRLHPRNARTVGLETGIQNGPLAITIVLVSYRQSEHLALVMMVPALYTLFIVFVSILVTLYFRRANLAEEQKIPSLL